MSGPEKATPQHLRRGAYLYVRQSSLHQVQDNKESTARQYNLKHRAVALGWNQDQIVVIDEDLGISGASGSKRNGFQRLVADVGLGRVGVVMGLEVSRLARSSADWHRLLEICALSETLILDEDGLYDPSHFNDRLLLGLKGTMSEAELHVLRARLLGGQLNKARRGELWLRAPIGFVHDLRGQLALDPDQQIQPTVRLLFETFHREGSAEKVIRHFRTQGIAFPRRIQTGVRAGEVLFVPLVHSRVLQILHNPRYAGAYVFGRTRQRKIVLPGMIRARRLPREEWKVFLPSAHPGYLSWEEFESNQKKLLENANGYGADRKKSPPREGAALLQGLVLCGRCGNRMTVRYHSERSRPVPEYTCQRKGIETATPICQLIQGTGLDEAVGKAILESVTPASLDIALEVFEELKTRRMEMDQLRLSKVQRLREEAEVAQRQYMLVRPENRLVLDALEREWNEKLQILRQAEEEYAKTAKGHGKEIAPEEKKRILALASDLPRVWNDPRTPMRDKKRMLRLLVEDITLVRSQRIEAHIRWKAGARTSLELPLPKSAADLKRTPAAIIEQIRALATEKTDSQIAEKLNDRVLRSGTGKPFTRQMVTALRYVYGIESLTTHLRKTGWLTVAETASELEIHPATAKQFAKAGVLQGMRTDDKGTILLKLPNGPLPKPHPGKRFKDRQQYPKLPDKPLTKQQREVQYAG